MDSQDKLNKLLNLIEELKKIDFQIAEHKKLGSHNFTIEQYENLKIKVWGKCMQDLISYSSDRNNLRKPDIYFLGQIAIKYFQQTPYYSDISESAYPEYAQLFKAI
jgi:hypothetical protein